MATYDELSKFLDEYDPQQPQQQQQPGADFSVSQQQLSPYEQMVRDRYGTLEQMQGQQAQEQPGLLGGFLNKTVKTPLFFGHFYIAEKQA